MFIVGYGVRSFHDGEDGDCGRPAYAEVSEEDTAGILGIEVTMEVEYFYGTVANIYQTIRCHNPVGHSVRYGIILHGVFLSIAINMPLYFMLEQHFLFDSICK